MAAGLVIPVSGPYAAVWDGFYLGTQNDDGFVLTGTYQGQEINASDAYGMTLVEAIFRGINWRLRMRSLEWNRPGVLRLLQAFTGIGDTRTVFSPTIGFIGDRWSKYSRVLTMNAILGNPPTIPQTLTAGSAIIAPQSNTEAMLTSKAREAPMELVLFPYGYTLNPGALFKEVTPSAAASTSAAIALSLRTQNVAFTTT